MRLPPPMILFVFAKFWLFDLISLWGTKRVFHIDYEMMILLLLLLNATHGTCAPLDGNNHKQIYQRGNIRNKYWLILFSPELVLNLNDIRLQVDMSWHVVDSMEDRDMRGINALFVFWPFITSELLSFFLPSILPSIHPSILPFLRSLFPQLNCMVDYLLCEQIIGDLSTTFTLNTDDCARIKKVNSIASPSSRKTELPSLDL